MHELSAQAEAIADAALVALRKHGYSGTSLARVAEEAGTSKRMVLHYFASRDALFDAVVRRMGGRLLGQMELAIAAQADPAAALDEGLDRLWEEVRADPGLHGVMVGLVAESITDASLRATLHAMRNEYRAVIGDVLVSSGAVGDASPEEVESFATLVLAALVGLTIDLLERGETSALERAFADFKRHVHLLAVAARDPAATPA
ncbi:MAG TPA: TetR/AcrR family transcriptional regulator [Solirubrobacteraceae bacterium]